MPSSPKRVVHRTTLADQVVEYIRDQISQNVLKPGQKLTIQGLADELNVSMTPVREALKTLAAMRLVKVEANKSVVIASPDAEEVRQLMVVYNRLETLALELIVESARDEDLDSLRAAAERSTAAVAASNQLEYFHANQDFHLLLVKLSGNAPLIEIYGSLNARLYPYRFRGMNDIDSRWSELAKEHHAIVDALYKRDSALATKIVKQHSRGARKHVNV